MRLAALLAVALAPSFVSAHGPLHGTISSDTTLTLSDSPVQLSADVIVAAGVTLTVQAGVQLVANAADDAASGNDPARVELIVNGTLLAQGTAGAPVSFSGAGTDWYGIEVQQGGTATLSHVAVGKALVGVTLATKASATISRSTLTAATCASVPGGALNIDRSTLSCASIGVDAEGGSSTLSRSVIRNAARAGIVVGGGAVSADHCDFISNAIGVELDTISFSNLPRVDSSIFFASRTSDAALTLNGIPLPVSYGIGGDYDDETNQGSSLFGAHAIALDPGFANAAVDDFHLGAASPCRGAGAGGTDIGAFPYDPGAPAQIVLTPSPAQAPAGGTLQLSATVLDGDGNPLSAAVTWASDAGSITAAGLFTAPCTPGVANVTATSGALHFIAAVQVLPGATTSLSLAPTQVSLQAKTSVMVQASTADACGNATADAVHWSATDGTIAASGTTAQAALYTASCTPGAHAQAIHAQVGSLLATADVSVAAGPLYALALTPSAPTLAAGASVQFSALGSDACGNTAQPGAVDWQVVNGGGTISAGGLFVAGTLAARFSQTVQAQAGGHTARADVTVSGGAGIASSLSLSPATATVSLNGSATFTATAVDSLGNAVSPGPLTWSVIHGGGTITQGGVFTANTVAGTYANTVQAQAGTLTASASVTVQAGGTASIAILPASVTIAPAGLTTFTAQAQDAVGNPTGAQVTWSVTNAAAGTISAAGVFQAGITAGTFAGAVRADAGAVHATADVTVSSAGLAGLRIDPHEGHLRAGDSLTFHCTGLDSSGNDVAVAAIWSVQQGGGAIDANGVFTAGSSAGVFTGTVSARAQGLQQVATVTVLVGDVASIVVTPAHASVAIGASQQFHAAALDAFGNTIEGEPVTWSADPRAGVIDAQGNFAAGGTPGEYTGAILASVGSAVGAASVTVTSNGSTPGVKHGGCGSAGADALALCGFALISRLRRRRG